MLRKTFDYLEAELPNVEPEAEKLKADITALEEGRDMHNKHEMTEAYE